MSNGRARLKDPAIRARVLAEMRAKPVGWESLYYQAGSADKLILIGFKNEKLKPLTGKTLARSREDARHNRPRTPRSTW